MICYKVTNEFDQSVIETSYRIQYIKRERVESHKIPRAFHYYLFAFETIKDARIFTFFGARVWRAEGTGPFLHLPWLPEDCSWPRGTIMFQGIKLLKRVSPFGQD